MAYAFKELSRAKIGDNKFLVISEREDGSIAIAQMLIFNDGGKDVPMFMKNSITMEKSSLNQVFGAVKTALED